MNERRTHSASEQDRLIRKDPRIAVVAERVKQASHSPMEVLPPNWSQWYCNELAIDLVSILDDGAQVPLIDLQDAGGSS